MKLNIFLMLMVGLVTTTSFAANSRGYCTVKEDQEHSFCSKTSYRVYYKNSGPEAVVSVLGGYCVNYTEESETRWMNQLDICDMEDRVGYYSIVYPGQEDRQLRSCHEYYGIAFNGVILSCLEADYRYRDFTLKDAIEIMNNWHKNNPNGIRK